MFLQEENKDQGNKILYKVKNGEIKTLFKVKGETTLSNRAQKFPLKYPIANPKLEHIEELARNLEQKINRQEITAIPFSSLLLETDNEKLNMRMCSLLELKQHEIKALLHFEGKGSFLVREYPDNGVMNFDIHYYAMDGTIKILKNYLGRLRHQGINRREKITFKRFINEIVAKHEKRRTSKEFENTNSSQKGS